MARFFSLFLTMLILRSSRRIHRSSICVNAFNIASGRTSVRVLPVHHSQSQKELISWVQRAELPSPTISRSYYATRLHSTVPDFSAASNDSSSSSPVLQGLNPSQIEAVTQPLSAITRVVAGPGSGKTRVLTCRIVHLLEEDRQSRVLAVTFTKKAAGEMQERLEKLLVAQELHKRKDTGVSVVEGDDVYLADLRRVSLGTFHSICAKILRWNGDQLANLSSIVRDMVGRESAISLDGSFAIMDEGDQLRVLKDCLELCNVDLKQSGLKIRSVLTAIGQYKSALAEGKDLLQNGGNKKSISPTMKIVAKVYGLYRDRLLSANCLDFDDLILLTRELLIEHPNVRESLHMRWTHVLVDEFQDTSRSQLDLVKLLTSSSLLIVGDADQSIYSWRGAHSGSLADFEREFQGYPNGVATVYLMENYRSTSNIVKAAQKVISHGAGGSGADKMRQNMKPRRGSGPPPRVVALADNEDEANFVVKSVKESRLSGTYDMDHSVAFIYRTNAQSRALEEACVKENLPYVIFGTSTSFYKRQEIKDCLSFLRWLQNGSDRLSMLRAMTAPKRGIGDKAIQEFDEYCELVQESFANFPDASSPTPLDILISFTDKEPINTAPKPAETMSTRSFKLMTEFSSQMRKIRELAYREPLEKVLDSIVTTFDLIAHVDKISKSVSEFEERKGNIRELQQAARKYTDQGPCMTNRKQGDGSKEKDESPLTSFLDDVALVTDMSERSAGERFVVNLMTIHASKGMEFDTVFVVGNEDGTFPTSQAIMEGDGSIQLEEEKRLCYVAMTRAKTELFLTWRREVSVFVADGKRTVNRSRSRFLDILISKDKQSGNQKSTENNQVGDRKLDPIQSSSSFRRPNDSANWKQKHSNIHSYSRRPQVQAPLKPASKLEGTNSVYAKPAPPQRTLATSATAKPKPARSENSLRSEPKATFQSTRIEDLVRSRAVVRQSPPAAIKSSDLKAENRPVEQSDKLHIKMTDQRDETDPKQSHSRQIAPNRPIDATWFFPVGAIVVHKRLGRGIVLPQPPNRKSGDEMMVHVEFKNGETKQFCATGSDLAPVFL